MKDYSKKDTQEVHKVQQVQETHQGQKAQEVYNVHEAQKDIGTTQGIICHGFI